MSVLVAYASRYGATRQIAQQVAAVLAVDGQDVRVRPAASIEDVGHHHAVVLGSARYHGGWMHEATAFVQRHLEALQARPVWLFSSGALGAGPVPEDPELTRTWQAVGARGGRAFGGALDTRRLDPLDRTLRLLAPPHHRLPAGDFRDWTDIDRWARRVSEELTRLAPGTEPVS